MPNSPSLTASASSPSQISALTFVSAVRESYPTNEVFAIPERTLPVALSQPPAPFLAARALSFWDFMRESKPSSSTPRPASAATSLRDIKRESEGVIQLERILSGKRAAAFGLHGGDSLRKDGKSGIDRLVETLLLDGDDLLYEVALLLKFGISGNVFGDDRFAERGKGTNPLFRATCRDAPRRRRDGRRIYPRPSFEGRTPSEMRKVEERM